jgi:hypothetical protein
VAGCYERSDEPSCSGATELVILDSVYIQTLTSGFDHFLLFLEYIRNFTTLLTTQHVIPLLHNNLQALFWFFHLCWLYLGYLHKTRYIWLHFISSLPYEYISKAWQGNWITCVFIAVCYLKEILIRKSEKQHVSSVRVSESSRQWDVLLQPVQAHQTSPTSQSISMAARCLISRYPTCSESITTPLQP